MLFVRSVPRHILSTAHRLVVPSAPSVTAEFDWRFYPLVFHVAFSSITVCQRSNRIFDMAVFSSTAAACFTSRLVVARFQYMITILINLASCVTSEPVKCVGKYLLPIEKSFSPAGSLYFPWDHRTGKKNDQCALLIPQRSESYTEGRGYYLS